MSRPKSNAPSNMAPWVKATEKDIDTLQRKVADIERSATGPAPSSNIGVGSAEVISIAQSVEGAISATLSNVSFDTDTTMESNLQIDGTLSVGNSTRFQLVDVGGTMESLPYEAPSFSMTGADEVVNPVTGATEFTPGYLTLNDVEVTGSNIHGAINANGLKLYMQDKGGTWYYPNEIVSNLQGVAGFMTITILGDKPEYAVGAYIAIINGGVYTTPKTAIYARSYDVPSGLTSITVATPYTDFVASGNAVIMQTFGYDAIPNTIELYAEQGEFGGDYTYISSGGIYVGSDVQPPVTGNAGVQITPTGITTSEVLTATGLVDAGLLDVGGGYGSTGASIDTDGNIATNGTVDVDSTLTVGGGFGNTGLTISSSGSISTDGFAYIGGGYGSTGTTISTSGNISTDGNLIVDGDADFGGGFGSTGLSILSNGQVQMSANALSITNGTGSIQIGSNTQTNLAIDNNDIQCRLSGAGAPLYLNRLGGDIYAGSTTVGFGIENGQVWATGVYGNALTTSYRSMYVSSTDAYDKLGYVASSRDEKKNIEPLSYTAEQILSVEPVQYHYNTEEDSAPKHPGMIAEDLHDAGLHGYVSYDKQGKPASINYEFYVSALQQVIRHQADQIASLSARLDALEAR